MLKTSKRVLMKGNGLPCFYADYTDEQLSAERNRNYVANCQVMYTAGYSEFDEPDCFDELERVDLDESNMPLVELY